MIAGRKRMAKHVVFLLICLGAPHTAVALQHRFVVRAAGCSSRRACRMVGEESSTAPDSRKVTAKAKRLIAIEGTGGVRPRKGAKHSEQKVASSGLGFGAKRSTLNFDRRPKTIGTDCLCGSGKAYGDCCAIAHERGGTESTEALVRARFSAYAYRLPEFLMQTTDPQGPEFVADTGAWTRSLLGFCDDFEMQSLEIGEVEQVAGDALLGHVAFRANMVKKGTLNLMTLCVRSKFRRGGDGNWLYVDGVVNYEAQS